MKWPREFSVYKILNWKSLITASGQLWFISEHEGKLALPILYHPMCNLRAERCASGYRPVSNYDMYRFTSLIFCQTRLKKWERLWYLNFSINTFGVLMSTSTLNGFLLFCIFSILLGNDSKSKLSKVKQVRKCGALQESTEFPEIITITNSSSDCLIVSQGFP